MTEHRSRWFQLSLKSLFLLVLVVAVFFAGYTLATKQAEAEKRKAESDAQQAIEESRRRSEDTLAERITANDALLQSMFEDPLRRERERRSQSKVGVADQ